MKRFRIIREQVNPTLRETTGAPSRITLPLNCHYYRLELYAFTVNEEGPFGLLFDGTYVGFTVDVGSPTTPPSSPIFIDSGSHSPLTYMQGSVELSDLNNGSTMLGLTNISGDPSEQRDQFSIVWVRGIYEEVPG